MKEIKIDICENTSLTTIICTLIVCVLAAAIGGCHITENTQRQAIKAGLVQKQSMGTAGVYWAKP
jgi:hypothetical protein